MSMNMGPVGPGSQGQHGRPGQMTAVMRAMAQQTGPKVLRIGLVHAGRIIEERIVKQRTSVTVGASERSMFVVPSPNIPPQFKLFELIGNDYYLNFLDGMSGRVALQTGITDIAALKGQARRVGPAYQVKLTEEARGKIVLGETTFLFQFVAPPPVQPRPQLPLAVKAGVAAAVDWNLTIIAAFSFMLHFGLVGAMYSDWMDPVVNDDITAGLIDMVKNAQPPAVEEKPPETAPTATTTATEAPKDPTPAPSAARTGGGKPAHGGSTGGSGNPDPRVVNQLLGEAEQAKIAILAALGGGTSTSGTLKDDHGAPVDLNSIANKGGGVSNSGSNLNTNLGGGGGPVTPGRGGGNLQDIRGGGDTGPGGVTTAGTATKVVITGNVTSGGVSASVPVSNAEAVIRGQIAGAARACYNRGLQTNPNQSGRVVILIQVGPSGEVQSASVASNSGLDPSVASCIASAARRARFDAPGGGGSTLSAPFNFVKQGG